MAATNARSTRRRNSGIRQNTNLPLRWRARRTGSSYAALRRRERQIPAADTVLRNWDDFVTFYDFPAEHWTHIKTSNPVESVFGGVRLRTDVAKRIRRRENALYLVYKIVRRLSRNWRALNGGPTLMAMVVAGELFKDGILQKCDSQAEVRTA